MTSAWGPARTMPRPTEKAEADLPRAEDHLLADRGAEELGVGALEEEADALVEALGEGLAAEPALRDLLAVEVAGALFREDEAVDELQEGRLARAVRPDGVIASP